VRPDPVALSIGKACWDELISSFHSISEMNVADAQYRLPVGAATLVELQPLTRYSVLLIQLIHGYRRLVDASVSVRAGNPQWPD
jgi:hypothetical protein